MIEKLKRNIILFIIIAAVLYLAFTIYGDFDDVLSAFADFNWLLLPILLMLTYFNFLTRFAKWHYYLKILSVKILLKDSFAIFMSGLIMSVTPGKFGELLKCYMVKKINGEPISKTAPIVLAERITDFISLILLALVGSYVFNYGKVIVVGTTIFFILLTYFISQKQIAIRIIDWIGKLKFLTKYTEKLHIAYESSYILLRPKPLFKMIFISLFSWFFECFGFYLILANFNLEYSILWPTFIYSFATIAGSITMLPAGLGVTEGSLVFLLVRDGVSKNIAVAATFIIRVVTLWFAILVGILSLSLYQKRFGKISTIE